MVLIALNDGVLSESVWDSASTLEGTHSSYPPRVLQNGEQYSPVNMARTYWHRLQQGHDFFTTIQIPPRRPREGPTCRRFLAGG